MAGTEPAVIVPALAGLDLTQSQPVIYDRPIGLRLLFADPGTGAEHYLVRYPARLTARRHTHTAAHTIVVLAGTSPPPRIFECWSRPGAGAGIEVVGGWVPSRCP